jgi:GTP-binding protein
MELGLEVYDSKMQHVQTSKLNEIMLKAIEAYRAPVVRGHIVKIKYVTQLPTHVPSFAFLPISQMILKCRTKIILKIN